MLVEGLPPSITARSKRQLGCGSPATASQQRRADPPAHLAAVGGAAVGPVAQQWSPAQLQCTGTVQLVARSAGPSGEGRRATSVCSRREHDRLVMVVMTQSGGNNRWMVGAHGAANNKRLRDACALYAAPGRELLATSHCWCSTQFLRNSGSQAAGKFQNIFHGSRYII